MWVGGWWRQSLSLTYRHLRSETSTPGLHCQLYIMHISLPSPPQKKKQVAQATLISPATIIWISGSSEDERTSSEQLQDLSGRNQWSNGRHMEAPINRHIETTQSAGHRLSFIQYNYMRHTVAVANLVPIKAGKDREGERERAREIMTSPPASLYT